MGRKNRSGLTGADAPECGERLEDSQGLLWFAFAFAGGIALHGLLPEEPSWVLLSLLLVIALLAVAVFRQREHLTVHAVLLLAFAGGMTAATVRTASVAAPRLAEQMNVTLTGQVLERQVDSSGTRLVLEVKRVGEHPASELVFPEKVRVRVPAGGSDAVGDLVEVRARLFPPAGPVFPGGYDYSYRAYFEGIGATGFSFGPARPAGSPEFTLPLRATAGISQLREYLAGRIRSVLSEGPETALIVALLVGDRSGIGEAEEEDLRAAGLAHILAISGLHMALFAGGAYAAVLLLLAAIPSLTLHWQIHKSSAIAALVAASFYLVLSGAAVATQRSFLMIAIVFMGILFGRRGLTLRSVALAGLVLLLIAPERLFAPGFQMSFAAVICLVAVYDTWRKRPRDDFGERRVSSAGHVFALGVGKWVAGLFVTALVAGLATGIIGAHHFGRIAPYGLVGNMLGMPVFSLIVMPMGVLALVLMPFGLAALPLGVMSFGVSLLLKIAAFTAGLEAGGGMMGRLDGLAAVLLLAALFAGLLLPGKRRLIAGLPLMAGLALAATSKPPDVQIPASGTQIAARDKAGEMRFAGRTGSFAAQLWLQAEGIPRGEILSRKMKSPQIRCDDEGCVVRAHRSPEVGTSPADVRPFVIAQSKRFESLETDCRKADFIVTDLIVPSGCRAAIVLDGGTRAARGAVSIWFAEPGGENYDLKILNGGAAESGGANTVAASEAGLSAKHGLAKMIFAIPDPPRPWHRRGSVTRDSLRDVLRNPSRSTAAH
jgi:competence protein ComEC